MPADAKHSKTEILSHRGFQLLTWRDRHQNNCELQQSSMAHYEKPGSSCVWLGIGGIDRMHLTVGRARWLSRQLAYWAEHGVFDGEDLEHVEDWPND